jgi:hypothetical protein
MDSKSNASAKFAHVDTFDVCNIVKCSWTPKGVASTAALLLPLMAVAIMSNGRTVALTATARAPSANPAHGNVILSAAARKVIEQQAVCAASASASAVLCTASLP